MPLPSGTMNSTEPWRNWTNSWRQRSFLAPLKGSEINELFDYIATIPQGNGAFPQFLQEVRYTLDVPNKRISDLTIGGAPVDPDRTYRFCTDDFLLRGGDGYTVLIKSQDPYNSSLLLSYVVIEYIRSRNGVISPANWVFTEDLAFLRR